MFGVVARGVARGSGIVALLPAQIHGAARHTPQPQAIGPANLVELEIPLVAWIPLGARPDLRGRLRITHQREQIVRSTLGRPDAIRDVGRALAGNRDVLHVRISQRCAGADQMRVDKEVAVARGGEMLVDSRAIRLAPRGPRSRRAPGTTRPVGTLRKPA